MRSYLLAFATVISITVQAQNVVFTDANLKAAILLDGKDTGGDGEISFLEAQAVDTLDVDSSSIASLADLSNFPNLKTLFAGHNNLSALAGLSLSDLSYLDLSYNNLVSFDAKNFPKLAYLSIANNSVLTSFNVTNLDSLTTFDFRSTDCKVVDFTGLSKLSSFGCDYAIDTLRTRSGYQISTSTFWQFKGINYLDLSNNAAVTGISLPVHPGYSIPVLNADDCPNLSTVTILNTAIEEFSFENDSSLTSIEVNNYRGSQLLADILKGVPNVVSVKIGKIADQDYNFIYALLKLEVFEIQIDSLDTFSLVSHPSLKTVKINKLGSFTANECDSLFSVSGTIDHLYVNNCLKFNHLSPDRVKKISIANCEEFSNFPQGWWNPEFSSTLEDLTITNCPALEALTVQWYGKGLSKINLEGSVNLTDLRLGGNQLTSVDLSTNTKIIRLEVPSNPLVSIDLSVLPALTYLNCNTTSMSQLDLCFEHQIDHLNANGHDSTFHVFVQDTNNINISTVLYSDDSASMFKQCPGTVKVPLVNSPISNKPIRAFDMMGQQIPLNSRNVVMIIEYDDGTFEKVFVVN